MFSQRGVEQYFLLTQLVLRTAIGQSRNQAETQNNGGSSRDDKG